MSSVDTRGQLAARQAELVRALVGDGPAPEGFDPARLEAARSALAGKRSREVARTWPALTHALGDRFEESFSAYAAVAPLPEYGGPLADGRAFAGYLAHRDNLPDAGRMEALSMDLCFAFTPSGMRRRRGAVIKLVLLRQPRRLVIAMRLPGVGATWLAIPLTLGLHQEK